MIDDVCIFFEGVPFVYVATFFFDGLFYSVFMWVGLEDDCVAFFTSFGLCKVRNFDCDLCVSISLIEEGKLMIMV